MEILALCISVLSLILVSVAYYRSGGQQDIRLLERGLNEKIERLSAMAQRATDSVAASVRAGYERSIRVISDLQSQVAALREGAVEEIREDLRMMAQTLDKQAERAAREVKEVKIEVNVRLQLPNDFLFKVDTASMRHSLEVRVPMLDEDLVSFGLSLPPALRASRGTEKIVLRGVAERRLPRSVVRRPKHGFAVPFDTWVDGDFKNNVRNALLSSEDLPEYLNRRIYEPWVRDFCTDSARSGLRRQGLYQRVVMLLGLDLALRKNGHSY